MKFTIALIFSFIFLFSFKSHGAPIDTSVTYQINKLLDESKSNLGSNNEKVFSLSTKALELSRKNKLRKQEAASLNLFGYYYLYESKFDIAIGYFERSLLIYKTLSDTSGIINEHYTIGQGLFYQGNYRKAMTHYNIAYDLAKKTSNLSRQANLLYEIGYVHYSQSNLKTALKYFQDALDIAEKLPDGKNIINSLYKGIGDIYFEWGDYTKAKEYFNLSLKINIEINSKQEEAFSINNLGNVHLKQQQFDLALEKYNQSKKIFEEINYKQGIAITLNNIGMAYENSNNIMKAIRYYEESIRIKNDIGDQAGVSRTLGIIADLLISEGEYQSAIIRLEKSQRIAISIELTPQIKENYKSFSRAYKMLGDKSKALSYFELFYNLHDSLFNEETQKQFTEMQTRFETEQKQKEIELLYKEKKLRNIELKQKNETLTKQKAIIFSIIGGLIMLIIFSVVVYRQYRQKKQANEILKQQKEEISSQRDEITTQRDQIEDQRDEISMINKDLTASIRYALRIQQALLPDEQTSKKLFGEHFLIYMPKDIVSGDFYWTSSRTEPDGSTSLIVAAADCTGHGVPGAFMSIVAMNLLEKAVHSEKLQHPSAILNYISNNIHILLRHSNNESELKDGMDISLCYFNREKGKLEFAGARNSLLIISDGKLTEIKGDKHYIGDIIENTAIKSYSNHHINISPNDNLYMYSDGYADQFGGGNRKKFMSSRLKELIHKNCHKPMETQGELLLQAHFKWKGKEYQVDDILVMGIKI